MWTNYLSYTMKMMKIANCYVTHIAICKNYSGEFQAFIDKNKRKEEN